MTDAVLIPVYNEGHTIEGVLDAVRVVFSGAVIVVDDGSSDETCAVLDERDDLVVVNHDDNLGYGRSLADGFARARHEGADRLVTMDCDGQHEPTHIPEFLAALASGPDIVSGSRYLPQSGRVGTPPSDRMRVNRSVTEEINRVTGWGITDAFCGFKAYRLSSIAEFVFCEDGYAMPLELWAKAYRAGLVVVELPVERIYFDGDRSFGEDLEDPDKRLGYYLRVWNDALEGVTA